MWRGLVVVTVVAAGGTIAARPAAACSCDATLFVFPEDGMIVPTNFAEIVVTGGTGDAASLESATDSIALGVPEPLFPEQPLVLYRIPVLGALAPSTEYTLLIGGLSPIHLTTSAGPDTAPPPAVAIGSLGLARADLEPGFVSSCGNTLIDMAAELSGVDEPAVMDMTVTGPDGVIQHLVLPYPWGPLLVGNGRCSLELDLEQGETYCVAIAAIDLAGNVGPATQQCVQTRACRDIGSDDEITSNLQECLVGGGGCSAGGGAAGGAPLAIIALAATATRRRRRRDRGCATTAPPAS